MKKSILFFLAMMAATAGYAQDSGIDAVTATGEKVRLFANGRWEYVDPKKAEVQREARRVEETRERETRERAAQGGLFGVGRRVYEGDKDYNRGSLNPKTR